MAKPSVVTEITFTALSLKRGGIDVATHPSQRKTRTTGSAAGLLAHD
jgi:hypothetical protein